jgi:hypothetical protein
MIGRFRDLLALPFLKGKDGIAAERQAGGPMDVLTAGANVPKQMIIKVFQPADGLAGLPVAHQALNKACARKASGQLGLMQCIVSHDTFLLFARK